MSSGKHINIRRGLLGLLLILTFHLTASAKSYWLGDVNGDGKITIIDLVQLNQILHGKLQKVKAADANNDGKVDKADAQTIMNIILGKIAKTEIPDNTFADGDQKNPDASGGNGGFGDSDQNNPGIDGGGGGFKDDDMKDPV